jgi:hypothetical protein
MSICCVGGEREEGESEVSTIRSSKAQTTSVNIESSFQRKQNVMQSRKRAGNPLECVSSIGRGNVNVDTRTFPTGFQPFLIENFRENIELFTEIGVFTRCVTRFFQFVYSSLRPVTTIFAASPR